MATQNCPKCKSNRVRIGYKKTGFFSKLFFRYNLLCNNCNLEFVGFGIPGTIAIKKNKAKKIPDPNYIDPRSVKSVKFEEINEMSFSDKTRNFEKEPQLIENQATLNENVETKLTQDNSESLEKKQKVRKRVKVKFS